MTIIADPGIKGAFAGAFTKAKDALKPTKPNVHERPLCAGPVILLVTLAARADVRTRKIPNQITFPAMLLSRDHYALGGPKDLVASLAGPRGGAGPDP